MSNELSSHDPKIGGALRAEFTHTQRVRPSEPSRQSRQRFPGTVHFHKALIENPKFVETSLYKLRNDSNRQEAYLSKLSDSLEPNDVRTKVGELVTTQLKYWEMLSALPCDDQDNDRTEFASKLVEYSENGTLGLLFYCYDRATHYINNPEQVFPDKSNQEVAKNWIKHAKKINVIRRSENNI